MSARAARRPTVALLAALLAAGGCGDGGAQAPAPAARPAPGPSAAPQPAPSGPGFAFRDAAKDAGLVWTSWCGRPSKPHLLESNGNGIALFDADGDGRLDVYVLSGWRIDGDRVAEKPGNRLYRNRGDGTFEDVTDASGLAGGEWASGVATGDFDGDGRTDVFVTNFGPDVLYRNEGGGRFSRVAGSPGIDGWSAGACFFDGDGDGDDDLFVAGYVEATLDEVLRAEPGLDWKDRKVMVGPFGLRGKANRYFRNDAGTFTDATSEAGLTDVGEYFSFAVAAADMDGDLDADLIVANDSNPNYVYRNEGGGRFTEAGLWCGAGLSGEGAAQAGMGLAIGDFDGDLAPDFLVTNFADDSSTLCRNLGRFLFRDVSRESGVRDPTFAPLSWGCAFADFDCDGDEDLFIANGHIYPQADDPPSTGTSFAQTNLLLANQGGRFTDVSASSGPGLAVRAVSHGVASGDLDDDGDVDLVVANMDGPPTLLVNESPRRGGSIVVDAPAAVRVVVEAGGRRMARFRVRGGSFCSVSDPRFHFGLGDAKSATVTVVDARGRETVVRDAAPGSVVRIP